MNIHSDLRADQDPLHHGRWGPLADYVEQLPQPSGGALGGGGATAAAPASAAILGDTAQWPPT